MHRFDYSVPHFITRIRSTRMAVTPDLIFEVLHIPKVEFANYPSYKSLRTMSKNKVTSRFRETHSSWGDH